jgi:hypothetical protein
VARVVTLRAVQYLILISLWVASLGIPARPGFDADGGAEEAGSGSASGANVAATRGVAPFWQVVLLAALLAAAFAVQLHVIGLAAQQQVPLPAWRAALPLVPIDDSAPLFGHTSQWIGIASGALAILQAVLLASLYFALRGRTVGRATWFGLGACAVVMAVEALRSSGLTSSDVYLYAGHGRLGLDAYAPPAARFPGEFGAINDLRGAPIYPSLYGPLWLAVAAGVVAAVHGLAAQLVAFRLVGCALFAVCAALVALLRREASSVVLFAVNPAFYEQYVANAHNDVLPLALTLGAIVVAARRTWLGVALVAAAGATKLPFALAGLVAFGAVTSRATRLALGACCVGGALAATYVASGGAYFATSARMSARITHDALVVATHDVTIALAVLAALLALVFVRYLSGASWSFVALSTTLFPWYVAWSVPYALLEERMLPVFLCALPVVTFLLTSVYALTPLSALLYVLAILAPLLLVARARRIRKA